jgi:dolichol-phosphate mannosyltransferase
VGRNIDDAISNKYFDIVIPVYNEQEVLGKTLDRLEEISDPLDYSFNIILIDDGSNDSSWDIISKKSGDDPHIQGIKLSRNFGQQAAISAGLSESDGDAVIILDADLQNPPELIPEFIEKWEEGYDVVYGKFKSRNDPFLKKLCVKIFYGFILKFTSINIPQNAADFSLMSCRVVDEINRLPERQKFIRGLRAWVGYSQTGIEYEKPERVEGESKYSYGKLIQLALDGLLSFSVIPLRISVLIGVLVSLVGFSYSLFIVIYRFLSSPPPGWTTLASLELILSGIQLLTLGIVGEYVGRIYEETKQRPEYIVETKLES